MKQELTSMATPDTPPTDYSRAPEFDRMVEMRDAAVEMRDGVRLSVDVYRPDAEDRFPALVAFSIYNKDLLGPDVAQSLPAQPAWAPLWAGLLEAGDTRFFVSRGYVHVIGSPRGIGKSGSGGARTWDCYDLIEWVAAQPWCDGNVGMVGISGFGAEQLAVAKQQPPHLKAIFPFDPRGAYGPFGGFREEYPGGVLHTFRYLIGHFSAFHQNRGAPGELSPEREALWREAMANADYRQYPHILNVVAQKGQHMPAYFDLLVDPYDREEWVAASEAESERVKVPTYTGSGWYGYTYKTHLNGAQSWYANLSCPKRLLLTGPAHLERPFHTLHGEILRWHDHWLKGIDTGVMTEPPVRYWVMGENRWRSAVDWPPPDVQWTKLYLNSWERLTPTPFTPGSVDDLVPPDTFVQMPPTRTSRVERLRYMTAPLGEEVLVAGPIVLTLHAAIDQDDTNWIVVLKDLGPDVSVQSAREGERGVPEGLPEREITRGWLKASMRALDPKRSKPGKPWHPLTRGSRRAVTPGEVAAYEIEIMATANLFRRGHRICLDITAADMPTGIGGATNAEYIPYHICSAKTVVHTIFHDTARPSHLLLPVLPAGA
jgi:predicted acyl esterase